MRGPRRVFQPRHRSDRRKYLREPAETDGQHLEAFNLSSFTPRLNSAAAAAGARIGKQPTQNSRSERSLYSFEKLRVARSRHGSLVRHFLVFGDVAGPGGKADRLYLYRARP